MLQAATTAPETLTMQGHRKQPASQATARAGITFVQIGFCTCATRFEAHIAMPILCVNTCSTTAALRP